MRRLLPLLTFGLALLVLVDGVAGLLARRSGDEQVTQGANATRSGSADVALKSPTGSPADGSPRRTEHRTADRGARLATLAELTREASLTYLDSLLASTDSVVRRWPDRDGMPLRVCLVPGGAPGYEPRMAELMHHALSRWEETGIGVRFMVVPDTALADIVVRWIDRFDIDRAGQTDLTWDQGGRVRRATISLALRTTTGATLPDPALLAVAVHEAGHALGLPHSADSNDVMFPATHTGTLSERDRRTALVLYRLPPGPVHDLATTGH